MHSRTLSACAMLLMSLSATSCLSLQMQSPGLARDVVAPTLTSTSCLALPQLTCMVGPTAGHTTAGKVVFQPVWESPSGGGAKGCYTRVTADIGGLNATSSHGFHIHTYGDLSNTDGTSTGGHFTNPAGDDLPHGLPGDSERHWGDFGNLDAVSDGTAKYNRVDDVIRLGGIVGRAITIHMQDDKGAAEQPTGDAGARVGFCVIGYANPDI